MNATHDEVLPGLWRKQGSMPQPLPHYRLVAFDMDSTLINIECIDEIADVAGRKAEVAAITEAAMRGEISDWRESLQRRLAMLKGVPSSTLERIVAERLRFNPGVEAFVAACRAAGLKTLLVSGGFTYFSDIVRTRLQLDFARAGVLGVDAQGRLSGELMPQAWGTYVDGAEKRRTLLELSSLMGIDAATQTIAVGDGANDLPMMGAAALSIAFHAKPAVRAHADIAVHEGGMDQALHALRGH
jgi:phosphoserine phosphatase